MIEILNQNSDVIKENNIKKSNCNINMEGEVKTSLLINDHDSNNKPTTTTVDGINIIELKEHEPKTWEELKEIILQDRLNELGRKVKEQIKMEIHMRGVRSEFKTVKDFIDHMVFKFPTQKISIGDGSYKSISIRPDSDGDNGGVEQLQKLVFRPNDFPYSCEDSISHWILWCLKPITFEEAKKIIEKFTNRKYANDENGFYFFVNPTHLQSIKEISHYHVFIKNIDIDQLEYST